jgi:hypothetical protein
VALERVGVWGPAGARAGRKNLKPQDKMQIHPSESSGRSGRGPADRSSSRSGSLSIRVRVGASDRPGRLPSTSAAAAGLEVHPSESSGRSAQGPGPAEPERSRGSNKSGSPSITVRVIRLARLRACRMQQQQVWNSVRPTRSRRAGRPAGSNRKSVRPFVVVSPCQMRITWPAASDDQSRQNHYLSIAG